ncbi:MAG: M28 family metallopeptidase [Candidatus Thermoplasmatota archaeon]|nr:M28 family metallopeptidase [Candidatus Thermoplasmatota archaeon]
MRSLFAAFSAFVFLLAVLSGCLGSSDSKLSIDEANVEILVNGAQNGIANAGEFANFSVISDMQNATLTLPPGFLVIQDGKLQSESNISLTSPEFNFKALVPPTGREFNFTVTDGERSKIITIQTANGTAPLISGKNIYDMVDSVTDVFLLRITGSPTLEAYKLWLKLTLESYGLETQITPVESGDGRTLLNVVAYHWGASKTDWIVIGGHADTAFEITVEGAYDNTAGTATVLELARILSQYKFDKTIVFGLWGGEEEGLFGSQFFTDNIPADVNVSAYLNFDMVGINWPGPFALHEFMACKNGVAVKEQVKFGKLVTHEICGFPENNKSFAIKKDTLGRSDHENFAALGIPSFMFIGELDNYPYYHTPDDTFANMIKYMGSEEKLVQGFAVPAWIGFYETILLQNGYSLAPAK